uniref:Single stranded DNA binding protein 4 n=1 Tax=Salarias fasciatus TaxID=181472 RepID=A0A672IUK5_SALFA
MYAKGKGAVVPSDSQAREKLALYVYEYLLHVGAQKSAQTFLSEIRWEKNITLGEPPGFLHSWWCVFWDLYCAAPDRRETCEHSSEAKAFHDYSAAAAPSPVMGNMPPNDGMPGGPMPPGFFPGPPGSQPSPHTQPPPHNPSNPMMGPHGQPFMSPRYPGGPRPSLRMPNQPPGSIPGSQPLLPNSLDPTRPQGTDRRTGGAIHTHKKTTLSANIYPSFLVSLCISVVNHADRPFNSNDSASFFDSDLITGSGDMDGLPKNSPNNMAGMNNPPGTPRDDGEMAGNFLNPFQSESVSTKPGNSSHINQSTRNRAKYLVACLQMTL